VMPFTSGTVMDVVLLLELPKRRQKIIAKRLN
jgi:hypothetical protein